MFENVDIRVKLDKTDAAFVDIMHTDAEPLLKGDIVANIQCSHELAKPYFIASINDNDVLAYPCASLDDYKAGRCTSCGSGCNHMGYKATSSPSGMFVLNTGATYPFKM
ncbi:pancreatic lipase-related protein 2-like [Littorina saxatilis]|uniref:Lipase domain-containing protein n=1 Tax=Littorina saxatilis TaxID=31220 RepID=A0AAN9C1K3_9CAEN